MRTAIAAPVLNLAPIHRLLTLAAGDFSLVVIRVNSPHDRRRMLKALQDSTPCSVVTLHPTVTNPLALLQDRAATLNPVAICVEGFEQVTDLPRVAAIANQLRDDWRSQLACPILLVMTDQTWAQFRRIAPDFCTWASTTAAIAA